MKARRIFNDESDEADYAAYEEYLSDMEDKAKEKYYEEKYG